MGARTYPRWRRQEPFSAVRDSLRRRWNPMADSRSPRRFPRTTTRQARAVQTSNGPRCRRSPQSLSQVRRCLTTAMVHPRAEYKAFPGVKAVLDLGDGSGDRGGRSRAHILRGWRFSTSEDLGRRVRHHRAGKRPGRRKR
jgi:hypothetical protein